VIGAVMMLAAAAAPAPVCGGCHRAQSEAWAGNSMANALYTPATSAILRDNARLEYRLGRFRYAIERRGGESVYTVTDGASTVSAPILYAFGQGFAGQTYVYRHDDKWFESRISYYRETKSLDLTMGAPPGEPKNVVEAAGREMTQKDVVACFECHTTGSIRREVGRSPAVDFEALRAGIDCDNCHTGAPAHAAGFRTGKPAPLAKLSRLDTEEQNDFCGRCHRTWADIAANGPRGVGNVRFQPYRIANSKCFDAADRRIACSACHNVHAALDRNLANYDVKCAACHGRGAAAGAARTKTCPKAKSNCASCHMPRYEIPGSHHLFTDHQIRIVRNADEPYPN
jgi:hypothetical protein